MKKNIFAAIFVCALVVLFSFVVQLVKADDVLVIGDDGYVTLIINNNGVLGVATSVKEEEKPKPVQTAEHKSPPASQQPQAPAKTEPLVAPHTESIVHIDPPVNNEKKVQIIITKNATQQNGNTQPQGGSGAPSQPPVKANAGQQMTTVAKTVDEVVAQGANGQPVLRIKSEKANQLTVEQGTTHVTTALPLQIDTLTNSLSVTPRVSSALPVLVLPSEAMQGIVDKGFLNAKSANQAKINLTKDTNGINYTVNSQKQGKLFGIFPVQSPVQVKLSAQNGKVVQASQSVLFNVFGKFIQ